MDEFSLIDRYFRPLASAGAGTAHPAVRLGIGDDAALLALPPGAVLVTSVDTLVADVHFPREADAADVGYRALAVAASDLAAMGADPLGCTLALTLPAVDAAWLEAFSAGFGEATVDYALPLVGGDTTRGDTIVVTVQVLGHCPDGMALRRDGARPGEQVLVSGTVGDGAAALAELRGEWTPAEPGVSLLPHFYRPTSQLALGCALRGIASAAIDISDGLLADLGHIADASGVALHLRTEAIPLAAAVRGAPQALDWALLGGDDYRLAFTLPPTVRTPPGCSVIGQVHEGRGLRLDGRPVSATGFRHF